MVSHLNISVYILGGIAPLRAEAPATGLNAGFKDRKGMRSAPPLGVVRTYVHGPTWRGATKGPARTRMSGYETYLPGRSDRIATVGDILILIRSVGGQRPAGASFPAPWRTNAGNFG